VVDVQGTPFFTLTGGGTYDFRQDLSKMGFRWDGIVPRAWAIEVTHITANQRAKDYLEQSMGVDLMPLTATPGTQPQPQQPVAQPQPPATPAVAPTVYNEGDAIEEDFTVLVSKPSKYNHYYLLEEASGVKMAVFMDDEGSVAGDTIRVSGIIKLENYNGRDQIRIIKPKVISQPSGQDAGDQQADAQPDDPNAVKGRIPDDRISPEQKGVEVSFLQSDDNVMMNALAGSGKAQPLDSLLLTPSGWKRMGDIRIGDSVFGSDGLSHKVRGVFPQGEKTVYRVTLSDRSSVECCGDHLWLTSTKQNRDLSRYHNEDLFYRSSVSSTMELKNTLLYKGYPNHYLPMVSSIEFQSAYTSIDPYMMGVLLGDGSFRTGGVAYSTKDQEIVSAINESLPDKLKSRHTGYGCDYRITSGVKGRRNEVVSEVKELGLWMTLSDDKFIPDVYKFNDKHSRIALLQGLMDSDGDISENGMSLCYSTVSEKMANDVQYIVQSLGGTAKISVRHTSYTHNGEKRQGKISYRLYIKMPTGIAPFRLNRKLLRYREPTKYLARRSVVSIEPIGEKECQCISIDSTDNLYVTDHCILTHNTTMLKHLASFKDPAEKWIYIVFGKKNQTEASSGKGKFPNGVEVKTSHSFLGNILAKSAKMDLIDSSSLIPRDYGGSRMFRMVDAYMKNDSTFPRHLNWPAKISISRLANLAKNFAVIPSDPGATDLLKGLIQSYTIDVTLEDNKNGVPSPNARDWTPQIIDKTMDMLHYSTPDNPLPEPDPNRNLFRGLRDQDDTLWYSAIYADQISWPRYDVVLADEVQDFNRCQVLMLQKLEEQGARIVAVGDPNQAVYRFRGGENETFDTITQNTGGAQHELPTNYRSGKNIIDYVNQNTKVHDLQAGLQHDGEVTEGMSYDGAIMGLQDEWTDGGGKLKEETAFISRVNAPLTSAAMDLLKRGMNFVVLGKDFSRELTKHVTSVVGKDQNKNERVMGIDQFMSELIRYSEDKQKKWKGRIAKSEALSKVTEATEALTSVVSHLREMNFFDQELNIRVNTTRDLRTYLVERFRGVDEDSAEKVQNMKKKDPRTFVLLTTAHRAKGMQFKRVFIVEDQLFPHPNAKNSEDLVQEGNLKYVAYTRAENELHVLEPKPDDQ
tara:strand:+ start:524 stop:3934 length:3411 start_codon:yes stop_codon:yes gene_type:complete